MAQESTLRPPASQLFGRLSGLGVSVPVAVAVCGAFLWSAQESPLPGLRWATVFLFLAVEHDVRALRIPNWLTFGGLAVALALGWADGGLSGLGRAAAGAGLAIGVLFVPFVLRWIGAGDVKAVAALGALWRADPIIPVIFWMFTSGGVLSIALLVARGELGDLLRRWGRSLWITLSAARVTYFGPAPGSAAGSGIPFAVAIGLGASIYQIWGFPWS